MKKIIKYTINIIYAGALLLILLGYFNAYHPLLDAISHFRLHFIGTATGLGLLLTLMNRAKMRYLHLFIVLLLGALFYYTTINFDSICKRMPNEKTIKHLQYNMNFRNKRLDEVVRFLAQEKPDIVTLQEVPKGHQEKLEQLKELYPYQAYCDFYPVVGAVAILSRYPFLDNETTCVKDNGLVVVKVEIEQKILTVASLHLRWPFPYEQYAQVDILKPYLNKIAAPALLAGDFNAAPWSYIVNDIATNSHMRVVGGVRWSIELAHQLPFVPYMKLPIDQLLLSDGVGLRNIKVLPHMGSDHYPVMDVVAIIDRHKLSHN